MSNNTGRKIPKNYPRGFGLEWLSKRLFRLGGYDFEIVTNFSHIMASRNETDESRFFLLKIPDVLQRYLNLFSERMPRNIVEVGIFRGGSAAFLQLTAKPERLLALELSPDRVDILDRFIESEGLEDSLKIAYGVDQADVALIRKLTTEHLGEGRCIDLVVDDASHLLAPTRTSLETLFPLLRPGGHYIIEDFSVSHIIMTELLDSALEGSENARKMIVQTLNVSLQADKKPLHVLAVEAMLAAAAAPGLIKEVIVDRQWLRIVRGDDDFEDPNAFDLRSLAADQFALLETEPSNVLSEFLD